MAPIATSVASARSTASGEDAAAAAQPDRGRDANPVLLELGNTGPSVRQVQISLDLVVDGIYGPRTERAVFDFQRSSDLPATGKVDRRTWIALLRHRPTAQATVSSVRPVAIEQPTPVAATAEAQSAPAPAPAPAKAAPKVAHSHVRRVAKLKVPAAPRRPAVAHSARPAASPAPAAASSAPAASGSTGRILAAIASCESGGNPTAVGGGGTYRGMYQFDQQTWESVGGTGDPAAASPADQTKRAAILYAQRGASAWPTCGAAAAHAASTAHMTVVSPRPQQPQQAQLQPQPTVSAAASPQPTATPAPAPTSAPATPTTADQKVTTASAPSDQPARPDATAVDAPAQSKSASQSKTGVTSVQADSSAQSSPASTGNGQNALNQSAPASELNQAAPTPAVTQSAPVPAPPVAGSSPQGAATGPAGPASGPTDPASSVQGIETPPAPQPQDPGASQPPASVGSATPVTPVDAHPAAKDEPSGAAAKEH